MALRQKGITEFVRGTRSSRPFRGLAFFTLVLVPPVRADATAATFCTQVLLPPVRAESTSATFLTQALMLPVRAESAAATFLTRALLLPVRADGTAATLFALALPPPVRADGTAATFLTRALPPPVLTLRVHSLRGAARFHDCLYDAAVLLASIALHGTGRIIQRCYCYRRCDLRPLPISVHRCNGFRRRLRLLPERVHFRNGRKGKRMMLFCFY